MRKGSRASIRLLVELETSVSRTSGVPALQRVAVGRQRETARLATGERRESRLTPAAADTTCRPALVAENYTLHAK